MRVAVVLMCLALVACNQHIPLEIRQAPALNPSFESVQADPGYFKGADVRWGGEIVGIENRQTDTILEIAARPLSSSGRPESGDKVYGRFLVRTDKFLEPSVYEKGRLLTIAGVVESLHQGKIDDHTYQYPVIFGLTLRLWPELPTYISDPYWGSYPPYGYPSSYFRFNYGYHHYPLYWRYDPYFRYR